MGAGRLDRRLAFESPKSVSDGAGNFVDGWDLQFTVAASVQPLRGGETVISSRLQGTQPSIVRIRASTQARSVTSAWRIVDARTDAVYQIKEPPRHPVDKAGREQRGWLEMMVTTGVAA